MMRNIIILIISLIPLLASSQLRYGFNLGGSWANPSLSDAQGYSLCNQSAFRGGLVVEYTLPGDRFAIDVSALYNRYNSRLRMPVTGPDGAIGISDSSFGRNFIEIPVHFKARHWLSISNGLMAPMIFTGPSFMFHVGSRGDGPLQTHRFQPGWDLGLGLDFLSFIQLSAGYRFGLGNAVDTFAGSPSATMHTSGWFLQTLILFDF